MAALWLAFTVGLAGGFGHCLGMCGPFVAAASISGGVSGSRSPRAAALFQAGYHVGRLLTYSALGALLGVLGAAGTLERLVGPAWVVPGQRYLGLAAGVLMVLVGLAMLGVPKLDRVMRTAETGISGRSWFVRTYARLQAGGWKSSVLLGMLLGLLPCGFLLGVEAWALVSGSAAAGAMTMLAFGLGTVPALAGFGLASGLLSTRLRGALTYVGAAAVSGLGLFAIGRALVKLAA
ncbi:MAG: sulfite exporter TauE/SafE family protein [Thermoleophilia bacterium]